MARFDVYANPDAQERKRVPFFLDVQNDPIQGIQTRVVIPLWKASVLAVRAEGINPLLQVQGQSVVLDAAALGAVPCNMLGAAVDNVSTQQLAIQDALDALFGGC
jgi:toxin CcdB